MGSRITLSSACDSGDISEVQSILSTVESSELDLEVQDACGRTPLIIAVASRHGRIDWEQDDRRKENIEDGELEDEAEEEECEDSAGTVTPTKYHILHLLLQHQANVNHQDERGWTALHYACQDRDLLAVRMLVHGGAQLLRDNFGLLPQDNLLLSRNKELNEQTVELTKILQDISAPSHYSLKLFSLRSSGVVQLDLGRQVQKDSMVTVEFTAPESHSNRDYIQLLYTFKGFNDMSFGSHHYVPLGAQGRLLISLKGIPSQSILHFVYVKSDINMISRQVVASGCNVVIQSSVNEVLQYEMYLYNQVLEVESDPEFEASDQPLVILKRVGMPSEDDENIEWANIQPNNYIVAVNDIRIDVMEFQDAIQVLQENNGKQSTKLLMQNHIALGDFIPEKVIGIGIIGKFAFLEPQDDSEVEETIMQSRLQDWTQSESDSLASQNGKKHAETDSQIVCKEDQLRNEETADPTDDGKYDTFFDRQKAIEPEIIRKSPEECPAIP